MLHAETLFGVGDGALPGNSDGTLALGLRVKGSHRVEVRASELLRRKKRKTSTRGLAHGYLCRETALLMETLTSKEGGRAHRREGFGIARLVNRAKRGRPTKERVEILLLSHLGLPVAGGVGQGQEIGGGSLEEHGVAGGLSKS